MRRLRHIAIDSVFAKFLMSQPDEVPVVSCLLFLRHYLLKRLLAVV